MKRSTMTFGLMVALLAGCNELVQPAGSSGASPKAQVAAGETRDYLQWPFPANSIWNMPLHTNASYSSAGI